MVKNNKQQGIVRMIVLGILMTNQTLVMFDLNPLPFSEEQIFEFVSIMTAWIWAGWTAWKNNNITDVALAGQSEIERIKGARKE